MIKKIDGVLSDDLIENIMEYFNNIIKKDVWSSSFGWDQNLGLISAATLTHKISDKILCEKIKKVIEKQ